MSLEFQFETFVDVYHSIFSEYLSSVIAKLPKENEKYRAMKEELSIIFFLSVLGHCDSSVSFLVGYRASCTRSDSVHSAYPLLRKADCNNTPRNNLIRPYSTNTHKGSGLWSYAR